MKVIVFGASGFVGGWICELLSERGDIDLVGCLRRWAGASRIARRGIELVQVDFNNTGDLSELVRGADAVINAAVPPPDREPNAALSLFSACAEANVRRFVQFSSAAVYGDLAGEVSEQSAPSPVDNYGRGKAEMEHRLLSVAAAAPQLFILRPSIIYGPFSDSWTVRYAKRISNGHWATLGWLGEGTCNLVHASDVARAAILCATDEVTSGTHVLNINGPGIVSWNEYIRRFGDALDIPNRIEPNSAKMLAMMVATEVIRTGGKWLLTRFGDVARKFTQSGQTGPAIIAGAKSLSELYPTIDEIKLLRRKVRYISLRAAEGIGFQPEVPLERGLKQSATWCQIHGVV